MEQKNKKIIQIKKGEFLLDVSRDGVFTTYKRNSAMDISNWTLERLGYILGNLHKVGYDKATVITVEAIAEATADTTADNKIGDNKNE